MNKILFLGPEVSDFLNPLAYELKNLGYTVDLLETRKAPRNNPEIAESYSNIIDFNDLINHKITLSKVLIYLLTIEVYKYFFKTVFFNCIEGKCRIIKSFRNALAYKHSKELFSRLFKQYDILSFHSLSTGLLSLVHFANKQNKIILSYWGSDLFQIWGFELISANELKDYYDQLNAIRRADKITAFSYEMERVIIAKFGPGIQNKIVRTLFNDNIEKYNLIDEFKRSAPHTDFLSKYVIPEKKIKVTIGYCGDPICNHLLIINELVKIEPEIKSRIHLLVPMTYGSFTEEYKGQVIDKLKQSNISFTIFDKYLSTEDLTKLRVTSNIMLMMSKSDALSASVCESLYAGNILISAVWLPYSPFRAEKIFLYESDFARLNETLVDCVNNFDQIQTKLMQNRDKIKSLTSFDRTLQNWTNILDSIN